MVASGAMIYWTLIGAWIGLLGVAFLLVGMAISVPSLLDLVGRGDRGRSRTSALFQGMRFVNGIVNVFAVVLALALTGVAAGLLVAVMAQEQWTVSSREVLGASVGMATSALGLILITREAGEADVPMSRSDWLRGIWILRQAAAVGAFVCVAGAAVGLALRDAAGAAVAMVTLAVVLTGWVRTDAMSRDGAVRHLAEATTEVSAALRTLTVQVWNHSDVLSSSEGRDLLVELERLELACYREMRRGIALPTPRFVVDPEIVTMVRACVIKLAGRATGQWDDPFLMEISRELAGVRTTEFLLELDKFVSDLRQLVILGPRRIDQP